MSTTDDDLTVEDEALSRIDVSQRTRDDDGWERLLTQEREAREELETLHSIAQMLSAELDLGKLVQAVTDAATSLSGAQFGAFFYNIIDGRGDRYTLYTLSGAPLEAFIDYPHPRSTQVFGPTFRGEGVVRFDDVTVDPRYGQNHPYSGLPAGHLPVRSYLAVPVVSRTHEVLGGLFFGHADAGVFTERSERRVVGIAAQAAIAIDNARLYQAAEQARSDARFHAERVEALAAASKAFAEAELEFHPLFTTIAERVSAILGDLCIIRLLSEDGHQLEPMAVAHPDPEAAEVMSSLMARVPHGSNEGLLGQVIEYGMPVLVPEWSSEQPETKIKSEFMQYVERFGMHSVLIVPLIGRESILGTLGVFRDTPGRPFTHADQSFLQELAGRAALAVQNARLYAQVRDALEERESFVSVAAHELRTPLTTIKAFGQLLDRELRQVDGIPARPVRLMASLSGQINRLEALVEDLLDASRLQQQPELRREQIDLVALVQEVLDRFEHDPWCTSRHELVLDAEMSVGGEWDTSRIDQVITNLISNALKYSPDGGEVRVAVRQMGDHAELRVSDQGIGIPADEQAMLFRPFSRGSATLRGIPGTGLGLYLTAQIVERHGGSISIDSQPSEGSCFTVTLPRTVTPRAE